MKVNDPNLSAPGTSGTSRAKEANRTEGTERPRHTLSTGIGTDDVHLSELVRSLRALASDSPERQALVERLERAVAEGNYQVDAKALSKKLIDDALAGD